MARLTQLATLLAAATTMASAGPTVHHSERVSFVVQVTKQGQNMTDINGYVMAAQHAGAGLDAMTIYPASAGAAIVSTNGTDADIKTGSTTLVSFSNYDMFASLEPTASGGPGMAGGVFEGFQGDHNGWGVVQNPQLSYGFIPGSHTPSMSFYACEQFVYLGPAIMLNTRNRYASTPANCSDVTLIAQCEGKWNTTAEAKPSALRLSPCYKDAQGYVASHKISS